MSFFGANGPDWAGPPPLQRVPRGPALLLFLAVCLLFWRVVFSPVAPIGDTSDGADPLATPQPEFLPIPTVQDNSLALPEGALVVLRDDAGLLLFRGAEPGRRLLEDQRVRSFKISPDGKWVAYELEAFDETPLPGIGNTLWVLPIDGGAPLKVMDTAALAHLTQDRERCRQTCAIEIDSTGWSWTPDSAALAFTTSVRSDYFSNEATPGSQPTVTFFEYRHRQDLWTQPINGGQARLILEADKGGHFVYSPDGSLIAISQSEGRFSPRQSRVAVAKADGTDWRVLLRMPYMYTESDWTSYPLPRWTADGRQLLLAAGVHLDPGFVSGGDTSYKGPVKLLRLGLDGSLQQLASGASGSIPMWRQNYNGYWSPDGAWLARLVNLAPWDQIGSTTYDGHLSSYPKPEYAFDYSGATAVPPLRALTVSSVARRTHQTYDWLRPTSPFCFSRTGSRFAYTPSSRHHEFPTEVRFGRIGEAPKPIRFDMRACHWISDDLLVLQDEHDLHLVRLDAHQRLLASGVSSQGERGRPLAAFEVHLPPPATATAAPPVTPPEGPLERQTLRTYRSSPLFSAAHFGSVDLGRMQARSSASVISWQAEGLPRGAPRDPSIAGARPWPPGEILAIDFDRGEVCVAATAKGQAIPAREDAAFNQTTWIKGDRRWDAGLIGGEAGVFRGGICGSPRKVALPSGEGPPLLVAAPYQAWEGLVSSGERFVVVDAQAQPRIIDGLTAVDWAFARWSIDRRWLAIVTAVHPPSGPPASDTRPGMDSPHELVLVEVSDGNRRSRTPNRNPLAPLWRKPLRLAVSEGEPLTRIDWLNDQAILLSSVSGAPDSIVWIDGRQQTVAELVGVAATDAKELRAQAQTHPIMSPKHVLVQPADAGGDTLLYHFESGNTESLGPASFGFHFDRIGQLAWRTDVRNDDAPLLTRPLDPPGAKAVAVTPPCGRRRADALASSKRIAGGVYMAPRYVELRPGGHMALRDVQTCALSELVAIEGVSHVQQAHLSPNDRYLLVTGGSDALDTLGLYIIDLLDVPFSAEIQPLTSLPAPPTDARATASEKPLANLVDGSTSLPYPSADWEPAPTAEPNRDPVLRSRSVQGCQVSLGGGREWDGPGQAHDAGQYTALIERSNGFGAAYVLEADDAEASFDGRVLDARFTPQTWAACDRAVRRMIEGLP